MQGLLVFFGSSSWTGFMTLLSLAELKCRKCLTRDGRARVLSILITPCFELPHLSQCQLLLRFRLWTQQLTIAMESCDCQIMPALLEDLSELSTNLECACSADNALRTRKMTKSSIFPLDRAIVKYQRRRAASTELLSANSFYHMVKVRLTQYLPLRVKCPSPLGERLNRAFRQLDKSYRSDLQSI